MRSLSEKEKYFYLENINTIRPTLIEGKNLKKGKLNGYTDNYIKIEIPYQDKFENKVIDVQMVAINKNGNINGITV